MANPDTPTANVSESNAKPSLSFATATKMRKNASIPNPPQLNTFRTCVVVRILFLRK